MPDFLGVLALDRGQTVIACDEAFCALFHCASVVDRGLDELLSPRDRKGARELSTKLVRGDRIDQLLTLQLEGREHLARVRMIPGADGYTLYAERVANDLVYKLTVIAERWKGMLRSSIDGLAMLDPLGSILEHNPVFFWLMGFRDNHGVTLSEAAVVGRPLLDLVGTRSPELAAYLKAPSGDFVTRFGDLELVASPIELPNRERIGTFVLVRDIREKAQIEARDAIIANDLANARAFQQMILAKPPRVAAHEIDIAYRPVSQVGGDIYDVRLLPDGRLRMFIADATGHGVTAALVTMLIKSSYDAVVAASTPSEVLALLNDRVAESSRSLDAMFTAAVVDLDLVTRQLTHASAAHLPPLLVHGAAVTELPCGGTFMGVSPGRVYPSWTHPLPEGSGLYLLTDGLAEARRIDGEQFGEDRVRRALVDASGLPQAGDAVLARLDSWLKPGKPDDDITIVGLRPAHA